MKPLLWRLADIADALSLANKTAEFLVRAPTFPRPIRFPNGRGGVSHPYWKPSEVEAWLESYQENTLERRPS